MMRWRRMTGWLLLVCWLTWIQAARGWAGASAMSAAWVPDPALLIFLAVAARLGSRPMARRHETTGYVGLVLAAAGAELCLSIQAAAPVLAGWVGVLLWQNLWRRGVDVERPLLRILMAGSAALGLGLWRRLVQGLDLAGEAARTQAELLPAGTGAWRGVLITAVLAPLVMPLLLALPGLPLYWRGR